MELDNTFDLLEVISGRGYPQAEVDISFAEDIAYRVREAEENLRSPLIEEGSKEAKELTKRLNDLRKALANSTYTFHLTGISGEVEDKLTEEANKLFPAPKMPKDGQGNMAKLQAWQEHATKAGQERTFAISVLNLQAKIMKIVRKSDGAVSEEPSYDAVTKLLQNLPESQREKLQNAINSLTVESSYFESEVNEDL